MGGDIPGYGRVAPVPSAVVGPGGITLAQAFVPTQRVPTLTERRASHFYKEGVHLTSPPGRCRECLTGLATLQR